MPAKKIALFYATVSGNAELLAHSTADHLRTRGLDCAVANLAERAEIDLSTPDAALFFASTWGEGEPPPDAAAFFQTLGAGAHPDLRGLPYAVVALGSKAYPEFCACGLRLDADLARRGALRLLPCLACDVKFRRPFADWLDVLGLKLDDIRRAACRA